MSDNDLPGQLPPRRSRAIRRPAAGAEPVPEPAALTPAEAPQARVEAPARLPAEPSPPVEGAPPLWNGRSADPPKPATRAPFPERSSARPPEAPRATGAAAAARRRSDSPPPPEAPILRMPQAPPSSSVGPLAALVVGLVLLGGALKLAWSSGQSTRTRTAVASPTPAAPPLSVVVPPVVVEKPDKPVYNPWADGKRPPVRRRPPVVVVQPPPPAETPAPPPRPVHSVKPRPQPRPAEIPTPDQQYPQAQVKPSVPAQVGYRPGPDPYDPYGLNPLPAGPAPVASKSLDMKVTTGLIIGGSEPLKAYSLSLLVHNRATTRIERMRILLKRGNESYETSSFAALEPGQRQELQLDFSGVPKKFHPQRIEVQWSTITGDFVTEKAVSDLGWDKDNGGASEPPPY